MGKFLSVNIFLMLACASTMQAASRRHVVIFGKPASVKLFLGSDESKPVDIKIRPLYVDGKLREFTTGDAHDITDRQFAVQRAYRVNDSLPADERTLPKWRWQRGGWLLVDRASGRVSPLRLPEFDAFYSDVAWYRDYAAYCGLADTGDKIYALVAQLGIHKPVLRSPLQTVSGAEPESACDRPLWQRDPARVTFILKDGRKLTFTIRGRAAGLAPAEAQTGKEEPN